MEKTPIAVIHYREFPEFLTQLLNDLEMTYIKDGLQPIKNHKTPRITVYAEVFNNDHASSLWWELKKSIDRNEVVEYNMVHHEYVPKNR